jgi:Tol biopolymer transport system component
MRVEVSMPGRFEEWVAISPDGRMLVSGGLADKRWQLWLRPLDSLNARPLEGTEGAIYPFWSPDSKSIGFFAEGKLKRVDIAGGPAQTLANAREPRGGAWGSNGTIIFTPALFGGLYRVPEKGGEATPLTQLESGQRSHRFPWFLPDGRHFLFFVTNAGAWVGSLDGAAPKRLALNSDSAAIFAPPGVLLFLRERTLMAQPFSVETLETTGNPVQVAEIFGVTGATNTGTLPVSAATNGAIAFRAASGVRSGGLRLAWFDRSGKEVGNVVSIERGYMFDAELSPSGTRVAVSRNPSARVGQFDIWLIETARGISTKLTSDESTDQFPVWSPDEQQLIFGSNRKGTFDLYAMPTNGSATETLLLELPGTTVPTNWSSDGRFMLYNELSPTTGYDQWALPLVGDQKPIQIANREFDELGGQLSQDRRWVAYESNETDRFEIVVQQFPNATGKTQISSGGGMMPRWRADGKELFYVASDGTLMGVPITVASDGKTLQPGAPVPLVRNRIVFDAYRGVRSGRYSVTADGQRFLMVVPAEEAVAPVVIFLNWAGNVLK